MNETSENRPYKELPWIDIHCRPGLSDGWEYPRDGFMGVGDGNYHPPPTGPGNFLLPFAVHDMIKTIEVEYHFEAGREAEIHAAEEGAPVYKISAPEGSVIIPVGSIREWFIRLPVGTRVRAHIDKWQWDLEKMAARARQWPKLTAEDLEIGRKLLEEARKRRERG